MKQYTIKQIQDEIKDDIELYYNLHKEKSSDLLDHCLALIDDLTNLYIQDIDRGRISIS